jgi:hypothetical protein
LGGDYPAVAHEIIATYRRLGDDAEQVAALDRDLASASCDNSNLCSTCPPGGAGPTELSSTDE